MDVEQIINNRVVQTASIGVASFAAGVGIGYVIGKRRGSTVVYVPEQFTSEHYVEEDISDQVEDEVEETDEQLLDSADVEEVSSDEVETEEEVILPHIDDDKVEEQDISTVNVFEGRTSDWDYDEELAGRTPDAPYILHQDEYINDEMGYTQTTLTFYSGDNILADEQDSPVYNYESVVGNLRFGHGSNDSNVVYIRNEKLSRV
jgi:hypothetical protein